MPAAPRSVRTALAVRPCLPITFPRSSGCTRSSRTVTCEPSTGRTCTSSGWSTRAFAMASTSSFILHLHVLDLRLAVEKAPRLTGDAQEMGTSLGLRDLLLVDKATNGVARLRTDSEPMLDAFGVELDLRGLLQRIVGSHQFNNAPVPWLAAFNHHHAVKRLLLLANPR